ncbi:MAG: PIG-L family deacetylase [Anaerolineales bacterium]|nr:MAG: PIG-L family deacetylase [Anaerolineales bacterium]
MDTLISNNSLPLQTLTFPKALRLFVLAPHPDDFDAIGVTMRFLRENGNPLYVAVAASGASGVEDTFCSPPTAEVKAKLREQEQRASCRFFGLPEAHLAFFRLEEDEAGHPLENEANTDRVRQHFLSKRPAMVFLPHGHDTNPGHRRVYAMFRQVAREAGYPLVAFLNRDPKTIRMRCDVYLGFGEEEAAWKGELLRFHRSQHQRNLNQRGHGMDERILRVDRQSAEACSVDAPYAEVFELEFFGASEFGDILAGLSPQTSCDIMGAGGKEANS